MSEVQTVKLTEQVKAGGCASKLSPAILDRVLSQLPKQTNENVLVGFETADDAGIYKLSDSLALVQTVDFFTPMVDDPYTYGQIAATNALSDIYAMGGIPISALAVLGYPEHGDLEVLAAIMAGGLSKMVEANCAVIGGHSVKDAEMKFGYAVTGTIHPDRVLKNKGAEVGDALLLTKAIGTGVITTAIKRGLARQEWIDAAVKSMTTLNKNAAVAITEARLRVHAMTDVTGFGLAGHSREMALANGVAIELEIDRIPLLRGAIECVQAKAVPAGPDCQSRLRRVRGRFANRNRAGSDDTLLRSANRWRIADFHRRARRRAAGADHRRGRNARRSHRSGRRARRWQTNSADLRR